MSNIPADKPFKQPPLVEETKPNPTDSEASKVAQDRSTPTLEDYKKKQYESSSIQPVPLVK